MDNAVCNLICAGLTERGLYCEIPIAVLIQRSLLTKLIIEGGDKFGFQNGGVSSPDLWETEAKTFQRDCVFFLCFVHFLDTPCTTCVSLQWNTWLYLLFLISVMKLGAPVFIFSEPEGKTLGRKGGKKFSVTSEKCWRPSYFSKNCNSQFLLTAIHFEIPTL